MLRRASWASTFWNLPALDQGSMDAIDAMPGKDLIPFPAPNAPARCANRCNGLNLPVVRLENRQNGNRIVSEEQCRCGKLLICEVHTAPPSLMPAVRQMGIALEDINMDRLRRENAWGIDSTNLCANNMSIAQDAWIKSEVK